VEGHEEVPGAKEAVTCWSGCFAGSSAVEAGGGVVAHGRQLQAAVLLFQAAEREIPALPFSGYFSFSFCSCLCVCFSTPVPLLVSVSSLSLISHSPSPLSLTVPLPCFQLPHFLSFFFFQSLSFSFFSFSSLRSLFFSLSSSCVLALGGIYGQRERGVPIAALLLRMGSRALLPCHGVGLAGQWAWLAGRGSPGLSSWGCVGLRVWQSTRGGRWAWRIKEEKNKSFFLPLLRVQGKKKAEQCCSKRHRSALFFLTWNDVVLDKMHRFI